MSGDRLTAAAHELRVISDWATELTVAVTLGDVDAAAKAVATIRGAAILASYTLDPQQRVSSAVTTTNGQYIAPAGQPAPDEATDPINPTHYRSHPSGVEVIRITEHMNFCLGNSVKYILRAGLKGDAVEDLKKARWYIDREIARLEGEES